MCLYQNIAWVFDFIPMEVSVVTKVGDNLFEMPLYTLMPKKKRKLWAIILNRHKTETEVEISLEHKLTKPLRMYIYDAENGPYDEFNDLQNYSAHIMAEDGMFTLKLNSNTAVILTTDYMDRKSSDITGIELKGKMLQWNECKDPKHCYYRVYKKEKQITSTVATYLNVEYEGEYFVYSVDRYGNCKNSNLIIKYFYFSLDILDPLC